MKLQFPELRTSDRVCWERTSMVPGGGLKPLSIYLLLLMHSSITADPLLVAITNVELGSITLSMSRRVMS